MQNFTIYGERDCGTKYIEKIIKKTFDIDIAWDYGWKHFFGRFDNEIKQSNNTIFICVTRNPYDWIMALFKHKHHLTFEMGNDIEKYLTQEWYSIEYQYGEWYQQKKPSNTPSELLSDRYWVDETRHKNIFQMRNRKMLYLYDMPKLTQNYIYIRFEDLMKNPDLIVQKISDKFNLAILSKGYDNPHKKEPYSISDHIKNIIDKNIEWKTEELFSYYKNQRIY